MCGQDASHSSQRPRSCQAAVSKAVPPICNLNKEVLALDLGKQCRSTDGWMNRCKDNGDDGPWMDPGCMMDDGDDGWIMMVVPLNGF